MQLSCFGEATEFLLPNPSPDSFSGGLSVPQPIYQFDTPLQTLRGGPCIMAAPLEVQYPWSCYILLLAPLELMHPGCYQLFVLAFSCLLCQSLVHLLVIHHSSFACSEICSWWKSVCELFTLSKSIHCVEVCPACLLVGLMQCSCS